MTKLLAYMLPGWFLILVFSLVTAYCVPVEVSSAPWFALMTVAIWAICVVVPCVIYYLRTPPGISYK
ncbi:MAG: hypothetical protein J6U07_05855 [Fibrobacter sp.]|uniref:hypothetical protein n=1 Tax=Fibrobacter sp. UWP2 TaxID=1896216 RepID=UPI0009142BDF|nr:hypothetical protein [Fibrobacter sp. UWP2]MBO7384111.1 hypothetical protein [Fibrobacter sp.]SHI44088.1 hypothetical protein SAMN05720471_10219 [Fibrobacter sp. UWP2]